MSRSLPPLVSWFGALAIAVTLSGCARSLPPGLDDATANKPPTDDPADDPSLEGVLLEVVGFNVESGGAQAAALADDIASIEGEAIWGLSEVEDESWAEAFQSAAADDNSQDFRFLLGTTGWSDHLAVMWDDERLALVAYWELHHINVGGTARSPLVAHLRSRETGSEFLFMVNHLWRSETGYRHQQAELLNTWAREQELPVIAVGDYNFDWEIETSDHDKGFDLLTKDDVFEWARPDPLVQTQCSTYYAPSVLDFVFTAGAAQRWNASSEVLFPESSYCPDDSAHSDHRPVRGSVRLP